MNTDGSPELVSLKRAHVSGDSVLRPWAAWSWLVVAVSARLYLVVVAALAFCALVPMLTGLTGSVVQSESMAPKISAGDVVLARPLTAEAATPMGRVVTFAAPSGSARGGLVLHRVVAAHDDGSLVTAGDANSAVDSTPLLRKDIIAQACLLIPWVGLPGFWFGTEQWLPLAIWMAVTALALAVEFVGLALDRETRRRSANPSTSRAKRSPGRRALAPIGVAGATLLAILVTSGAGTVPVDAAFSARTVSVGSSWTAKVAAPATKLAFTTNASSSTGGRAFAVQPAVMVQNAAGGLTTGTRTVTLTLTNANGAVLACTANPLTSATGVFSFAGCAIDKVGSYTLTARSGTLTAAVSGTVAITAGPAAALRFLAQPSTTVAGTAFATQPRVALLDAGGNATTSTAPVTLALTTPAGAVLTCTRNPSSAVGGVATFAGCRVDKAGTYTLTASSGSLTTAVSAAFVITAVVHPQLTCRSSTWYATFGWSPTPFAPTTYRLYVNGRQVPASGADGWNSYVQLSAENVPAATFPQGTATVEVRKVLSTGQEQVMGVGKVILGAAGYRTYLCG